MRRVAPLLLVVLLAGPALAGRDPVDVKVQVDAHASPTPRPAILIDGDAAFDAAHGVRRGSGTAADPYVISGWTLSHDRLSALALRNTRAHVVIENVHVPRQTSQPGVRECDVATFACPIYTGVELTNATNVTLRASLLAQEEVGVFLRGSHDVLVEGVTVGDGSPDGLPVTGWGVLVHDSSRVTLRGLDVVDADYAFELKGSRDVTVERTLFNGSALHARGVSLIAPLDGVTLAENRFESVKVFTLGELRNLTVVRNEFEGPFAGFGNGAFGLLRDSVFCGNAFLGGDTALIAAETVNVRVAGNRFEGNRQGIKLGPADNLTLERNLVQGSQTEGAWLVGARLTIQDNAFVSNGKGVFLPTNGTNASGNWWGDASGPSGIGPGAGDALRTLAGRTVHHEPWLTTPPDLSDPCQGPADPLPPPPRAPLRVDAHAKARIRVLDLLDVSAGESRSLRSDELLP